MPEIKTYPYNRFFIYLLFVAGLGATAVFIGLSMQQFKQATAKTTQLQATTNWLKFADSVQQHLEETPPIIAADSGKTRARHIQWMKNKIGLLQQDLHRINKAIQQQPQTAKQFSHLRQKLTTQLKSNQQKIKATENTATPLPPHFGSDSDSSGTDSLMIVQADQLQQDIAQLENANKNNTRYYLGLAAFTGLLMLVFFIFYRYYFKQRQMAQQQLSSQASLLETIPDAIFTVNTQFVVLSWNKYAEEIYGVTEAEAKGKPLQELFTLQFTEEQFTQNLQALNRDGFFKSEYQIKKRDGQIIFVLVSASVISNNKGEITSYLVLHRDISTRKAFEDRLLRFNQDLENQVNAKTAELSEIFERITDGFIALDNQWRYTYVNAQVANLLGKSPANFIGKNIWTDFPDSANETYFFEYYNNAMQQQHYQFFELYYPPLQIWIENHIYPSPSGLSVYFRNITEKKKADEEAEKARRLNDNIIDSLPGIFYMYDGKANQLLRWNKRVENITGFTAEEISEKYFIEFVDENYREQLMLSIGEAYRMGQHSAETKLITKMGKKLDFYFTAMVITIEGNQYLIGNGIDITERKQAEKKLQQNINQLQLLAALGDNMGNATTLDEICRYGITAMSLSTGAHKGAIGLYNDSYMPMTVTSHQLSTAQQSLMQRVLPAIKPSDLKTIAITHLHQYAENEWYHALQQQQFAAALFVPVHNQNQLLGIVALFFDTPQNFATNSIQYAETIARHLAFAISEKKSANELRRSQQKYMLLFNNNPMPMWMLSFPDRNFIDVNTAAINHYGYSKEDFLKMNANDIRPESEKEKFRTEIVAGKHQQTYNGIWRHKKKNGEVIWVEILAHDIVYEGNQVRLILANNINEKIKAEEKLQESYQQIRQLATHLQNIREQERTSIAREIHDELGQQLTGLKMQVSWLHKKMSWQEPAIKDKYAATLQLIEDTIHSVRKISTSLRPSMLDDLGLIAAMEWQNNEFEKRSGINTEFINLTGNFTIPPQYVTGLFRIFQESLTNVARHADAKKIKTIIQYSQQQLQLTITDDGRGFVVNNIGSKKTLGLFGMKERTMEMGGSYEIISAPGKGTTVSVTIPIAATIDNRSPDPSAV
jgi:PAS domain S-box-containing protein